MLERFSYDITTWLTIFARWTDRRCCDLHESRQLHLDFGILRQRRICPSNSVLEDHCERAVCFWRKMPGPDVLNCGFREEWMAGSRFCPDHVSGLHFEFGFYFTALPSPQVQLQDIEVRQR